MKSYKLKIELHESLIDEEMEKDIEKLKNHFESKGYKIDKKEILENAVLLGIKWHIKDNLRAYSKDI